MRMKLRVSEWQRGEGGGVKAAMSECVVSEWVDECVSECVSEWVSEWVSVWVGG
jgi:hypothetical protein